MISTFYFSITLRPLDSILFAFDFSQIKMITGDFVVFKWYYLTLLTLPFLYWIVFRLIRSIQNTRLIAWSGLIFVISALLFGIQIKSDQYLHSEITTNKTYHFFYSFCNTDEDTQLSIERSVIAFQKNENKNFTSLKYPLLHEVERQNPLKPFLALDDNTPPNFVFLIVESLSSSFSGRNAKEISYTPFLDSLGDHSLYFENSLATGERTFAVLPSLLGSLPHGRRGFTNEKHGFPSANSLLKWLVANGYHSSFNYGGHARFDYMDLFLKDHDLQKIYNREEYNYEGTNLKTSIDEVPFGISDKQLLNEVYARQNSNKHSPYIDIILTLSMHYPFIVEDQDGYIKEVQDIIRKSNASDEIKLKHNKYLKEFSTVKYTDDVLKAYFNKRKSSTDHKNTVYIILGDHMMTDIPHWSSIEKYRVPLIIYSPLLARTKTIRAVNSHLDIAPSIYELIKQQYPFRAIENAHWLGEPFDTIKEYRNQRTILFMRNDRKYKDFLHKDYFSSDGKYFHLEPNLELSKTNRIDDSELLFRAYKTIHTYTVSKNMIRPDDHGKVLYTDEKFRIDITDSSEFHNLFSQALPYNMNGLNLLVDLSFGRGWKRSKSTSDESQPMLIVSIKRGEQNYLWKKINLELVEKSIGEIRNIKFNIKNNMEFELKKGDEISLYFWNISKDQITFETTVHKIELSGY